MNPREILLQMTLEEKVSLVQGASFFGTQEIERLGLPRIQFLDGGTGINFEQLFGDFCDLPALQEINKDLKEIKEQYAQVLTLLNEIVRRCK